MAEKMSKYAAKKARQAETGEVGYLTCEVAGEVKIVASEKKALTPEEQSAKDKARNAANVAQDHAAVALHAKSFMGRMADANIAMAESAQYIALAKAQAHGSVKGEVNAIAGLYEVAYEKAQSALLRARMLLAVLEGAKGARK